MNFALTITEIVTDLGEWEGRQVTVQGVFFAYGKPARHRYKRRGLQKTIFPGFSSVFLKGFERASLVWRDIDYRAYLVPVGFDISCMARQELLSLLGSPERIRFKLLHFLPEKIARRLVQTCFPTPVVKVSCRELFSTLGKFPDRFQVPELVAFCNGGYTSQLLVELTGRVERSPHPEFAFVLTDVSFIQVRTYMPQERQTHTFAMTIPPG